MHTLYERECCPQLLFTIKIIEDTRMPEDSLTSRVLSKEVLIGLLGLLLLGLVAAGMVVPGVVTWF